jgi:hypothetical protein
VAFGERLQQIILVLTETHPQNPVFFLQISSLLGSGLLVGEPPDQAVKSCGGQGFTVERKHEGSRPRNWWAGIGLHFRLRLSTKNIASKFSAEGKLELSKDEAQNQLTRLHTIGEASVSQSGRQALGPERSYRRQMRRWFKRFFEMFDWLHGQRSNGAVPCLS